MHLKFTLLLLLLLFSSLFNFTFSQTADQKKQIMEIVKDFYSNLALYSGPKGKEDPNLFTRILKYKDGEDAVYHANDLFTSRTRDNIYPNWLTYLSDIADEDDNSIDVNYSDPVILDCIESKAGTSYVITKVSKSLLYKGQSKTENELILLNLTNNRISEVIFPDFYLSKNGSCQAVTSFNLSQNNEESKKQLNEYRKEADELFDNKKFTSAKSLYEKILSEYSESDKVTIRKKIGDCNKEISEQLYKKNIDYGDYYYQKGIYNQARYFYEAALQIKPADGYALNKLLLSKAADPVVVKNEIDEAVKLADESKNNYGKAFRIMNEYEQSNLLTTENYYFLTLMMFKRNNDVRKEMNLSKRDCDNYLNIFVKKLKERNQTESNKEMKDKAAFLYEEVINPRYQK